MMELQKRIQQIENKIADAITEEGLDSIYEALKLCRKLNNDLQEIFNVRSNDCNHHFRLATGQCVKCGAEIGDN